MRNSRAALAMALVGAMSWCLVQAKGEAVGQDKPVVQIPQAGVPQITTLEGKFVRAAYNNEGYVILGYQASNRSVGEDWMLLEIGMTVLDKTPEFQMTRRVLARDA